MGDVPWCGGCVVPEVPGGRRVGREFMREDTVVSTETSMGDGSLVVAALVVELRAVADAAGLR